jgi:carbamoyltransferase
MQSRMNLKIKFRESFRPFAPSALEEDGANYFEALDSSPYMLLVAPVEDSIRKDLSEGNQKLMKDPDLLKRVHVERSKLPAITHVDYSARVQTVTEARYGRYYRLIKAFKEKTGCAVLVNTSFNVRGEPIVQTPQDALRCFLSTGMDVLVMENCILLKKDQPEALLDRCKGYEESFNLD